MANNEKAGVVQVADVFGAAGDSGSSSRAGSPAFWSYVWVAVAVAVIVGFHVRVFGIPLPPNARFPT